eukprot:SAG22_NODE_2784_length_2212_cov_2.925225_4_plen_53_part_00
MQPPPSHKKKAEEAEINEDGVPLRDDPFKVSKHRRYTVICWPSLSIPVECRH